MNRADSLKILEQIVAGGAVLQLPRLEVNPLIAVFEVIDDRRAFFVEAHAQDQHHAHVLEFASWRADHELGVGFYDAAGEFVAYLCPIREACLPNEERYLESWQAWQELLADAEERELFTDFVNQERTSQLGLNPPL